MGVSVLVYGWTSKQHSVMGTKSQLRQKSVTIKSDENLIFAKTFLASVFRSTIHDCKVSNSSKSIREWRSRRSASLQKKKVRIRRGGEGSFPTNGLCWVHNYLQKTKSFWHSNHWPVSNFYNQRPMNIRPQSYLKSSAAIRYIPLPKGFIRTEYVKEVQKLEEFTFLLFSLVKTNLFEVN